jgi:hypothetical protein
MRTEIVTCLINSTSEEIFRLHSPDLPSNPMLRLLCWGRLRGFLTHMSEMSEEARKAVEVLQERVVKALQDAGYLNLNTFYAKRHILAAMEDILMVKWRRGGNVWTVGKMLPISWKTMLPMSWRTVLPYEIRYEKTRAEKIRDAEYCALGITIPMTRAQVCSESVLMKIFRNPDGALRKKQVPSDK